MKKETHPENYRQVVFTDTQIDESWLCKSMVETEKTIEFEGKEYPHYELTVSDKSHPFYTGNEKIVDSEGRVEKFKKKFGM